MPALAATQVDPEELQRELCSAARPLLIDVCSPGEFATGHLPGAMNVPLEQLGSRVRDFAWSENPVIVCRSGQRATLAQQSLGMIGLQVRVLTGGMGGWSRAGLPTVRSVQAHWALERQVRFTAGLLVVAGIALSFAVSRLWVGLAGIVGLGLTMSGITGLCPMASVLGRMPWNRLRTEKAPAAGAGCSL